MKGKYVNSVDIDRLGMVYSVGEVSDSSVAGLCQKKDIGEDRAVMPHGSTCQDFFSIQFFADPSCKQPFTKYSGGWGLI